MQPSPIHLDVLQKTYRSLGVVFIKLHIAYLAVDLSRYDCVLEGSLIRLSLNIVLILSNTLTEGSHGTVKL